MTTKTRFPSIADVRAALLHQCEYLGAPDSHPDMQRARAALTKAKQA